MSRCNSCQLSLLTEVSELWRRWLLPCSFFQMPFLQAFLSQTISVSAAQLNILLHFYQ